MLPPVVAPADLAPVYDASTDIAPAVVSAVDTTTVDSPDIVVPVGDTQSVAATAITSDIISWNAKERAWIHVPFSMRYSPVSGTYYAFISDVGGDSRSLLYHIKGECLALTRTGDNGEENKCNFYDVIWDRKFICSPASDGYDPNLAALFSKFVHVIAHHMTIVLAPPLRRASSLVI